MAQTFRIVAQGKSEPRRKDYITSETWNKGTPKQLKLEQEGMKIISVTRITRTPEGTECAPVEL